MNNEDEKLDRLLRNWRVQGQDPHLAAEVWQRIASREESAWSRDAVFSNWFGRSLAGPALAATLFLAAVLGGIGLAELRVQQAREFTSVENREQAYFESINPVAVAYQGHRR